MTAATTLKVNRSDGEQLGGGGTEPLSPLHPAVVKSAAPPSQHRRRIPILIIGASDRPGRYRALRAGKSLRWVSDQLGHADPAFTLRVYAHAMRDEESDLSFAEFDGSKRLYPAPGDGRPTQNKNALGLTSRGRYQNVERETGLEPATLSLGS